MPPVYSKQDVALMAHLLRRAGFGATPQELDAYLDKGYEASVEELLNPVSDDVLPSRSHQQSLDIVGIQMVNLAHEFFGQISEYGQAEGQMVWKLWTDVARGIFDLYTDLKEHNASDDVLIFVFSEFGRRVKDHGNGTDHGSGGVSFLIGDRVRGGHYSEYPSLAADQLVEGDLAFNLDFRLVYTEILEDWLDVDAKPIVKGTYEKVGCFN